MATSNFDRIRSVWNYIYPDVHEPHIACYQLLRKDFPFKYSDMGCVNVMQHVIQYPFNRDTCGLNVKDIVQYLKGPSLRKIKFYNDELSMWFLFSKGTIFYPTGRIMLQFGYIDGRKTLFVNNELVTATDKVSKFIYNSIVKCCMKNYIDVWFSNMDSTIKWVVNSDVLFGNDTQVSGNGYIWQKE